MPLDPKSETMLLKVHPGLARRVRALLMACEAKGCPMRVTQGLRDGMEQTALYAQGRQGLDEVNRLRKLACLPPITSEQNQCPVTDARLGFSYHNYGLAIDLCYATGDPYHEDGHSLTWEQIGAMIEANGLVWGGRFRMRPDRPHCQWSDGVSLADLRAGKVPPMEATP